MYDEIKCRKKFVIQIRKDSIMKMISLYLFVKIICTYVQGVPLNSFRMFNAIRMLHENCTL